MKSGGNAPEVARVARDHQVSSSYRADDDAGVDHVGGPRLPAGPTGRPAALLVENLDLAAFQQPGQAGLWPAAPHLAEHAGRDGRTGSSFQRPPVQRPKCSLVSLRGDEGAGIVGDSSHDSKLARSTWSACRPIEGGVGGRKFCRRQRSLFRLPFSNCIKTRFDRQLVIGRLVEPRRKAEAGAVGGTAGRLGNVLLECHGNLANHHVPDGSTIFVPLRVIVDQGAVPEPSTCGWFPRPQTARSRRTEESSVRSDVAPAATTSPASSTT